MRENNRGTWSYKYEHGLNTYFYPFRVMDEKMWDILKKRPKVAKLIGEIKDFERMLKRKVKEEKERKEQEQIFHYQLNVGMICPNCNNFVGTARPYICPHCQEPIPKNIDHKIETKTDKMVKELDDSFKEWNKKNKKK